MDLNITDKTWGEITAWFVGPVPSGARVEYSGCGTHMVTLTVRDDTEVTAEADKVYLGGPVANRPLTPAEQATEKADRSLGF